MKGASETKSVGYAYPSSKYAAQLGYAREGCWYVLVRKGVGERLVGSAPSVREAFALAEARPEPFEAGHRALEEWLERLGGAA